MTERIETELIVALDLPTLDEALRIVDVTSASVKWYKVGYEAFYAFGPRLIADLRERGKRVFLDLKLHDIPKSVAGGIRSLGNLGASLLTVHGSGGRAMLAAAAAARDDVNRSGGDLRLLAVTLLTSLDRPALREVGVGESPHALVGIRASLAAECDMDGIVCAVDEIAIVRTQVGPHFLIVCPGIRQAGDAASDQRRVATPTDAMLAGATAIVVGRPITHATDPAAAARAIMDEITAAIPIKRSIDAE